MVVFVAVERCSLTVLIRVEIARADIPVFVRRDERKPAIGEYQLYHGLLYIEEHSYRGAKFDNVFINFNGIRLTPVDYFKYLFFFFLFIVPYGEGPKGHLLCSSKW